MGGKIVYEIAQQLSRAGHEVALLALLDCSRPGYPRRASFLVRTWLHLRHGLAMEPAQARRYLAERVWRLRKYLVSIRPKLFGGDAEGRLQPAKAMQESADAVARACARYVPTFYPGALVQIRAEVRPSYPGAIDDDPELGWGPLVGGGVRRESMQCSHREMLTPEFAPPLAAVLATHLVPG
jgi:acetoacetyl-CoA synthetase